MNTIKLIADILTEGNAYMVKHRGGAQFVRRVFKGSEKGVLEMERLVFSSKVKKGVYAEVVHNTNSEGEKTGVRFFYWKNTQLAPRQEISIPYFDIQEIKEC